MTPGQKLLKQIEAERKKLGVFRSYPEAHKLEKKAGGFRAPQGTPSARHLKRRDKWKAAPRRGWS